MVDPSRGGDAAVTAGPRRRSPEHASRPTVSTDVGPLTHVVVGAQSPDVDVQPLQPRSVARRLVEDVGDVVAEQHELVERVGVRVEQFVGVLSPLDPPFPRRQLPVSAEPDSATYCARRHRWRSRRLGEQIGFDAAAQPLVRIARLRAQVRHADQEQQRPADVARSQPLVIRKQVDRRLRSRRRHARSSPPF